MPFVEKNITYEDLMRLSKSHLALLVLDHRKSIEELEAKAMVVDNVRGMK